MAISTLRLGNGHLHELVLQSDAASSVNILSLLLLHTFCSELTSDLISMWFIAYMLYHGTCTTPLTMPAHATSALVNTHTQLLSCCLCGAALRLPSLL